MKYGIYVELCIKINPESDKNPLYPDFLIM